MSGNRPRPYKQLSPLELQFLEENYLRFSDIELSYILKRKPDNIRKLRQLFGLKRRGASKEALKDILQQPLVIWLPRESFEGVDTSKLHIRKI